MRLFKTDIDKLVAQNDIPGLIKVLKKSNPEISEKAFHALTSIKDRQDEIIENIKNLLSELNPRVRTLAAIMLARTNDDSAYQTLKKLIIYGTVKEKVEVLRVLGGHRDSHNLSIANIFALALKDPKGIVRMHAIKAMGESSDSSYIPYLSEALNDKMFNIRLEAAKALGNIGDETTVDALIGALLDPNSDVRIAVKEALSKIGNEKALNALNGAPFNILVEKMKTNVASREETIKQIKRQKIKDGIPLVRKALFDHYKVIRIEAVKTLVAMGDRDASESIAGLLDDKYWDVRLEAVKALGILGRQEVMDAVERASNDKNKNVRDEARKLYYSFKVRFGDPEEDK